MIVYKYLHQDRLKNVLSEGLIRFTQAAALNDPFESTPITKDLFRSWVERQRELVRTQHTNLTGMDKIAIDADILRRINDGINEVIDPIRHNVGILSVSLERSELLMWSHYCDSHRGFVVGFNGLHPYFQIGIPDKRGGLRPVIYDKNRPTLPKFEDFHHQSKLAELVLFRKSPHWKYENELRMLHNINYADKEIDNDQVGQKIYLFHFPPESVTEVILGCQMTSSHKQEITAITKDKYPNAKVFQAVMSKSEFALVLEPII